MKALSLRLAPRSTGRPRFIAILAAGLALAGTSIGARAAEIFSSDFSKGTFEKLGWTAKGDWSIVNFGDNKAGLEKNPGPVAKFPANGKKAGMLTKTFDVIKDPANLTLTFDAGYGWGGKTHVQAIQVMLLDADGNGYVFDSHRAKATWGAQWGLVTQYGYDKTLNWSPTPIDTTQGAVIDGAGLRTFTVTRDAGGTFKFSGEGWEGGTPFAFTDKTTTQFTQVVLFGTPNTDDLLYGKVKLEAEKAK